MTLYLDLHKAVQIPSSGTDSSSETKEARRYKESFARTHSGVMGGDASPNRPDVGANWKESEDLQDELEQERKLDSEIAQERGVVSKKDDSTKKAIDILKSFSSDLNEQIAKSLPNEREIEYLTTVCGYDVDDVMKGYAKITGHERSKFHAWLHQRLKKSINRLVAR